MHIEEGVEKLLNDERKPYNIQFEEYLQTFGIEGKSFDSIEDCVIKITESNIYTRSKNSENMVSAMKLSIKCLFIFPLLKFTLGKDFSSIQNSASCGSQNTITNLLIKNGINFEVVTELGVDTSHEELTSNEEFDHFYDVLLNNVENSPETRKTIQFKKSFLRMVECCYTDPHTRKLVINESQSVDLFCNSYLTPLEMLFSIFNFSSSTTSSICEVNRGISISESINLGKSPKTVHLRPDVSILKEGVLPLVPFEFKGYNSQRMFESLFKASVQKENHILNQLFLYMLSMESQIGVLSDGYNILEVCIDIDGLGHAKKVQNKKTKTLTVPLKVHSFNLEESQGFNTMTTIAIILARLIRKSKTGQLDAIKTKIRSYKPLFIKSAEEVTYELKERAKKYLIQKSQTSSTTLSYEESQYLGEYEEIQIGFHFNSQVLGLKFYEAEKLLGCQLKIQPLGSLTRNSEVVMKIFDPIRKLFAKDLDNSHEKSIILKSIEDSKDQEVKIYKRIQSFNETSEKKINAPVILKDGYIKLDFGSDFFLGPYILMDRLYDKPTQPEHFETAKQQLHLLHSAGIYHGDIKISNTFYQNGKFYFIDFGFSLLENKYNFDLMSSKDKKEL